MDAWQSSSPTHVPYAINLLASYSVRNVFFKFATQNLCCGVHGVYFSSLEAYGWAVKFNIVLEFDTIPL